MLEKWNFITAKIYVFFFIIDEKVCTLFMKLGLSRKMYIVFLTFALLVIDILTVIILRETISTTTMVLRAIVFPIYVIITYFYILWLKDKSRGLDTLKVGPNLYVRHSWIGTFKFVFNINCIMIVVFSGYYVMRPTHLLFSLINLFVGLLYFNSVSHSGPTEPDATVWSKAKSKIKDFAGSFNRPVLIPQPIGA